MNPSVVAYTLREPVGVVGAIIPWNYPLMMAAWKVAPALAAGNTLVLKPATPLTAIRLGELALEAGIPPGVLNVVPGPGAEVGEAIAAHAGIDKVAFTGETATGRRIAEAAARTSSGSASSSGASHRTSSSPMPTSTPRSSARCGRSITRPASHARHAPGSWCRTRCTRRSHRPSPRRASSLTVGDPLADDTKVGSLISRGHADMVRGFIDLGLEDGGELLAGGDVDLNGDLDADAFVAPTVIGGIANDARIFQEEVFGLVVTLTRFSDEAEAVRMANDVRYGLAATVWTADGARGDRVARAFDRARSATRRLWRSPASVRRPRSRATGASSRSMPSISTPRRRRCWDVAEAGEPARGVAGSRGMGKATLSPTARARGERFDGRG